MTTEHLVTAVRKLAAIRRAGLVEELHVELRERQATMPMTDKSGLPLGAALEIRDLARLAAAVLKVPEHKARELAVEALGLRTHQRVAREVIDETHRLVEGTTPAAGDAEPDAVARARRAS